MSERSRSLRKGRGKAGFTVLEVVMAIVIMGLIVTPLSMALVQATNLVPESGERTQHATDTARLITIFNDDVAQMQKLRTGTDVRFDSETWTEANSSLSYALCSAGTYPIARFEWRDLGVVGSTPTTVDYTARVYGEGDRTHVELVREAAGEAQVVTRGYCKSAYEAGNSSLVPISLGGASNPNGYQLTLTMHVRDRGGVAAPPEVVSANARVRQS